jgi:outer membrane protein assembly factor BamB
VRAAQVTLAVALAAAAPGLGAQERVLPRVPAAAVAREAARTEAPRWVLRLGPVRVDEMRPAGEDGILVGLRQDELELRNLEFLLVGRDDGAVRWRWKRDRTGSSGTLVVLEDAVVFHTTEDDRYTITSVALATGARRWAHSWKGDTVTARPAIAADRVLLERRRKDRVDVLAVALSDGREAWSVQARVPRGRWSPPPVIWPGGVLVFTDGTTRVAPDDGRTLWARPELLPDSGDAPAHVDQGTAYLTEGGALHALDLETGATRWRTDLAAYDAVTNVFPDSDLVLVRGVVRFEGSGAILGNGVYLLSALDAADGTVRWQRRTLRPTVSNFVRLNGRVFVAGIDRLWAFDEATGTPRFEVETGAARLYPVRLRAYPDRIAFIGEHVLAAFDPVSGERMSWVGTTPLSQATTLAGLDAAIPRIREQLEALQAHAGRVEAAGQNPLSGSYAAAEMRRYQNMSNQYWRQAWSDRSRGDAWGFEMKSNLAQMNTAWAKAMANAAFALSVLDLVRKFLEYRLKLEIAKVEGLLERQLMFREAVLTGNAAAEWGNLVWRPHMQIAGGDEFASITIADVATGQRRTTIVSANYEDHGLWSLLDPDRGVLYHAGIGLDTAGWVWSREHSYWPRRKVQTIETLLVATPVSVPDMAH